MIDYFVVLFRVAKELTISGGAVCSGLLCDPSDMSFLKHLNKNEVLSNDQPR